MASCKYLPLLSLLFITTTAIASTNDPKIIPADQMIWKNLPHHTGLQYTILSGNPLQKDWFVARIKLPANFSDEIHTHDLTRYDTVMSGTYYFQFADAAKKTGVTKLAAGGFIECPANVKHTGYTKAETVIEIAGMGPWEVLKSNGQQR